MSVRSIAVAQTVPVRGDVNANLARHVRLVRAVAGEHPQVVVFPELSLTGYELELGPQLAFSENDPRLLPLLDSAASCSVILVVGAPLRIGSKLHIGAFIISPSGAVEIHTKEHLGAFSSAVSPDGVVPPPEDTLFSPGDRCPLIPIGDSTAAIGVCAESLQEWHPKRAADRGANTYLTSHFGIPLDGPFRAAVLREHAIRHSMAVAFANHGGPTGGLAAGGKSAIWSETGELLAELGPTGEGAVIAHESEAGWRVTTVDVA